MNERRTPGVLIRHWTAIVGIALLGLFAARMAQDFGKPTAFGTAGAPFSDALGPWLHGALSLHLFGDAPGDLYRPTIGLFFGSVIAATGRTEAIPLFFCAFLVGGMALGLAYADRGLRIAALLWVAMSVLYWKRTLAPLNVGTLTIDLAALGFGLSGALLVLSMKEYRDSSVPVLGALLLGIAAAIRGPLLLAGPILLLPLVVKFVKVERRRVAAAAVVIAFCLPYLADSLLQRQFEIVNNGIEALYCVYSDPAHSWTSECGRRFRTGDIRTVRFETAEVMANYLAFLRSPEGVGFVMRGVAGRAGLDARAFLWRSFLGLSMIAVLWAWWSAGSARRRRHVVAAAAILGILAGAVNFTALHASFALVMTTGFAGLLAAWSRKVRPLVLILAYWCAALFISLFGLSYEERFAGTFTFLLYIGLILLPLDMPETSPEVPSRPSVILGSSIVGALLAFLYTGALLMESDLMHRYRTEVDGQRAALKLSDDVSLNRSLYLNGNRALFYTRRDDVAVGQVRRYRKLIGPYFNESYVDPAQFED